MVQKLSLLRGFKKQSILEKDQEDPPNPSLDPSLLEKDREDPPNPSLDPSLLEKDREDPPNPGPDQEDQADGLKHRLNPKNQDVELHLEDLLPALIENHLHLQENQ